MVMASYTIMSFYAGVDNPRTIIKRKRRDAAALAFEREVYALIKANAGLDTKWGWKAYHAAQQAYDPEYTSVTVEIGPYKDTVTFARTH